MQQSFGAAKEANAQAEGLNKQSRHLVQQVNRGFFCQLFFCCCPNCSSNPSPKAIKSAPAPQAQAQPESLSKGQKIAPPSTEEKVKSASSRTSERLIQGFQDADGSNWRKTLLPAPWIKTEVRQFTPRGPRPIGQTTSRDDEFRMANQIWHKQMDGGLRELQEVCEEMGQKLEEQAQLAQMLSLYLDYGAEQALQANKLLANEKKLNT